MMKPIGGYFELELAHGVEYHPNAIRLNTGRNCLEYILRAKGYKKVFLPYYTCEVILEPFKKLGVSYDFYHIDLHLEIQENIKLGINEALLYVNYFGLKQRYVECLAEKYRNYLIVDNTQAFYAKPIAGTDTFYTCRKFFGVPDGAYLYTEKKLAEELEQDMSFDRMTFLNKRIDLGAEAAYGDFKNLSKSLIGQPIKQMSNLTQCLMLSIDYKKIAQQRRNNYTQLHSALSESNSMNIPLEEDAVPMVYPYLVPVDGLRERLIMNKVFVACYWPNVQEWTSEQNTEHLLACKMLPLPIDQRYGKEDIEYITRLIRK